MHRFGRLALFTYVGLDDDRTEGMETPAHLAALLPLLPLIRRFLPLLHDQARQLGVTASDVDDVVSDALVSAVVGTDQDRPRPSPDQEEDVKAWALDRVKWAALDHIGRRSRARVTVWDDPAAAQAVPDARDLVSIINDRESILRALPKVRPEYREILLAVDAEEKAVADVARDLGIPYSTAYKYLCRGREQLRDALNRLEARGVNPTPRANRRRAGALLPFGFAGFRAQLARFFGSWPPRLCASFAVGAAIVAFIPGSKAGATASVPSVAPPSVVVSVPSGGVAPSSPGVQGTTPTTAAVVTPVKAPGGLVGHAPLPGRPRAPQVRASQGGEPESELRTLRARNDLRRGGKLVHGEAGADMGRAQAILRSVVVSR